ncbi:MAG: type I-U CRISPR-associated RAMP protein Csb1/Cas7u [Candidatus Binataceae bacterium]
MTIGYDKLKDVPRLLMEAKLKPLQGHRFQPTGFADLGPARYTLPDGTEMLLVESAQSVANRMELACWDDAMQGLLPKLSGLPYIKIIDQNGGHLSNSLLEAHRINSEYVMKESRRVIAAEGQPEVAQKSFNEEFAVEIGYEKDGRVDWKKFHLGLLKYDPNSLIHGCFLEEIGGRLRATRILSGFIEASGIAGAESGGVKNNIVQPELKGGEGNVPFHRTEFTAREIKSYFNLDLALVRGYGLPEEAHRLLIALSLFKVKRFLSTGLRLRTACDLEMEDELTVRRPDGFEIPGEDELLNECERLIRACKSYFADPAVTEVEWKQKERPIEVRLPEGTQEPAIPDDLKGKIEWKKGTAKKQPALSFKKGLTQGMVERAKKLFEGNARVAQAIDDELNKQRSDRKDNSDTSGKDDDGSDDP